MGSGTTNLTIPQIQGRSWLSPYQGKQVATEGVITAVQRSGPKPGFYLQDVRGDDDPYTSDALFVTSSALDDDEFVAGLTPGTIVQVAGKVVETNNFTTITAEKSGIAPTRAAQDGAVLPQPTELHIPDNPARAQSYLEAREGMYAELDDAMVVGPTNRSGDFTAVDASRHGSRRSSDSRAGARLAVGTVLISGTPQLATGARPGRLVGPLSYAYEDYRLLQTEPLKATQHSPLAPAMWGDLTGDDRLTEEDFAGIRARYGQDAHGPLDAADLNGDGRITRADLNWAKKRAERITDAPKVSIASFNAWNLFDTVDDPVGDTVETTDRYTQKLTKLATAIRDDLGAPDVLAVQEVENDRVLQDLIERPELAALNYSYKLLDGPDPRGINVAFLHRGNIAVNDVRQAQASADIGDGLRGLDANGRDVLFSRPPLLADLTIENDGKTEDLTLVVNHFKSKFSPNNLPTEPRRIAQAEFVGKLVDQLRTERPDREVLVLGDFNDTHDSKPLKILTGTGDDARLTNMVTDLAPPAERYSYNYKGATELIDHLLATPDLAARTEIAGVRHFNADVPISESWDTNSSGSSDHDAPYMRFRLSGAGQAAAGVASLSEIADKTAALFSGTPAPDAADE